MHLNHLWSLAVEEQFYILFPVFICVIKTKRRLFIGGLVIINMVLIARLIYYFFIDSNVLKIYWNTFFMIDSFIMGFTLYMAIENGFLNIIKRFVTQCLIFCFIVYGICCVLSGGFRINYFTSTWVFLYWL